MKLISVHVAKAGGSSLLSIFQAAYGPRLHPDYAENPADPKSPRNLDPTRYLARAEPFPETASCIHGHFHPGKYSIPQDAILSTILRHPIENLISIHFFWKTLPKGHDALHDYFLANNLTLLETAKLPLLRHLYSKTYFGDFDMSRFNLIGRHDARLKALTQLSNLTGAPFDTSIHENPTQPTDERHEAEQNPNLRRHLEDILTEDLNFYHHHTR